MADENKLVPRENGRAVEVMAMPQRFPSFDLSPREPHLYDYLLILRKHQWLILSFLLTVVTIVSIATFRMRPVYTSHRPHRDRSREHQHPSVPGRRCLRFHDGSRQLHRDPIHSHQRNPGAANHSQHRAGRNPELGGNGLGSEAIATGSLANQKRPPEVGAFLGSLSVKRIPYSRLMEVSYESTDPELAARILNAHLENFKEQNIHSRYEATPRQPAGLPPSSTN